MVTQTSWTGALLAPVTVITTLEAWKVSTAFLLPAAPPMVLKSVIRRLG